MTSSIEITHINDPDDVSFERLVEILLAAFAFQDDIVDPPSSAKSVSVSELQWRFARDTLFVARDGKGNIIGQIWIEDVGKDAYLYKLSVDPAVKGLVSARHWSRPPARLRVIAASSICGLVFGSNLKTISRSSNHAGLRLPAKVFMTDMTERRSGKWRAICSKSDQAGLLSGIGRFDIA